MPCVVCMGGCGRQWSGAGCCVVGSCNVVATEHGRYGLSCMQKLWECMSSTGSV